MHLFKHNIREFITNFKQLQGDPHYIALGMAIGLFVSMTPTVPFHTLLAVFLAFILRGSKRAAAIGVWFTNPITLPFCYLADYKIGRILIYSSSPFNAEHNTISELLKLGMDVFYAMLLGGLLLGCLAGVAAYFITHKIVANIRSSGKTTS